MRRLSFSTAEGETVTAEIRRALAAGYTGRDRAAVQAHIDELAEIGVAPPPRVPMLFPVSPALLTTEAEIAVLGTDSTPEIEVALFRAGGVDYVTVASDQTDRVVETRSIAQAKNLCPKPLGGVVWPVAEVAAHWDTLTLTARCEGAVLQQGSLAELMDHAALLDFVAEHDGPDHEGRLILSGTVPTETRPPSGAATIELVLGDPVRGRDIRHLYRIAPMAEIFPEDAG